MSELLPDISPIPVKERLSLLFIERCRIDVKDNAFVMIDKDGVRTHVPLGGVACLMLEPGVRISHRAVHLAAKTGTLLVWVGEGGVRLYSAGQPGGARSDKLLYQAQLALSEAGRLKVVREMYRRRFQDEPPAKRSVTQLRGIEGARVKKTYQLLAQRHGVTWKGRRYDADIWDNSDLPNQCISAATACLYGVCEAAILAAGYAPAIGFIHHGKPQAFVYDIADIYKFDTVIPLAFQIAARSPAKPEREIRIACRDLFRETHLLKNIIPDIEDILAAGGETPPPPPADAIGPAIPNKKGLGDAGHRN